MSFLKRALRAVTRRWGKSLLLLVIFFVIANLVLAGFSIREAVDAAKDSARQQLGATLTLSFNQQKAMEEAMSSMQQEGQNGGGQGGGRQSRPAFSLQTQPVTEEMALKVAGLPHVQAYNYVVSASASAGDFDPVDTGGDSGGSVEAVPDVGGGWGGEGSISFTLPDVSLTGVYSSSLYDSFASGAFTLEEGEHLVYSGDSDVRPVLIEKNLAAYNGLSVGDTLTVTAMTDDESEEASAPSYTLTVVGIYSAGSTDSGGSLGGFQLSFSQGYNQLIVDYKTALDIKGNTTASIMGGMGQSSEGIDSVTFYVDDPLNVDAVIEASKDLDIDWETFKLDANSAAYETMIAPLENIASFSTLLVVVVSAAGGGVLALILAMWIRERMYETGVLLSLGEGRFKVILQYVCEVLLVALVAFTLAIFSGMFVSQKIGDLLVAQQNSSSQSASDNGGMAMPDRQGEGQWPGGRVDFIGGQQGLTQATAQNLDVSVGWAAILRLYGLGILLVLAATAIPSALVMRYKPRTILTRAG